MSETGANGRLADAINRAALVVSLAIAAAVGALWLHARARPAEAPRWPDARTVALVPAAPAGRDRWIVAVNPGCPHCRARLATLDSALAKRPAPPELGVLLVDVARRPDSLVGGARFAAGVWWDSAGACEESGGRMRRRRPSGENTSTSP